MTRRADGADVDGGSPAPAGARRDGRGRARAQGPQPVVYARRRFLRHRLAMVGLVVLVIIFGAGIFANYVAPYSSREIDLNNILHAPTTHGHHFFGTDEIGRDYFSRVICGIRTSEEVGVFVAVVSSILGLFVGALAGYYGGWIDNLLMRITDLVLTLPALAILLRPPRCSGRAASGASRSSSRSSSGRVARIVRGIFLSLREKEYVEAAKAARRGRHRGSCSGTSSRTRSARSSSTARSPSPPRSSPRLRSRSSASASSPDAVARRARSPSGQTNPQQWWLTVFPGLTISDRALRQLRRRRPARRPRPDPAESPCLSRPLDQEPRRRVQDRRRHRPRGRRHHLRRLPERDARHRRRVGLGQERHDAGDPRADPAAAGPHRQRHGDVQGQGSAEDEEARAARASAATRSRWSSRTR